MPTRIVHFFSLRNNPQSFDFDLSLAVDRLWVAHDQRLDLARQCPHQAEHHRLMAGLAAWEAGILAGRALDAEQQEQAVLA